MPRKAIAPQVDSDSKWNKENDVSQGSHLWTEADTPIVGIIFNFCQRICTHYLIVL